MESSIFDRTGPTEKSSPPRKVDLVFFFFSNFSDWSEPIHSILVEWIAPQKIAPPYKLTFVIAAERRKSASFLLSTLAPPGNHASRIPKPVLQVSYLWH